jgi:hypothetical protein
VRICREWNVENKCRKKVFAHLLVGVTV